MYLLIGYEFDPWCWHVATILRNRGHDAIVTPDPLAGDSAFTWALETTRSVSSLRPGQQPAIDATGLQGVLVRTQGGPASVEGWAPDDFAYVQSEAQAALLAWLAQLPCPVINRLSADLWFRPYRPFLEWRALLHRCGLPTLMAAVTNSLPDARQFAMRWGGVSYTPITSSSRYPVADDAQWDELGKVMTHVPVCLVEPSAGPSSYACVVGESVAWSVGSDLRPAERALFETGLRRLAGALDLATVELEVRRGRDGPRSVGVQLFPRPEWYGLDAQEMLATRLVELLGAAQ